jgi:O-antigen/teichoic acid export membrane protein
MDSTGVWARATGWLGRRRLVRDAGVLVAGTGAAQLGLLLCMPAIMHIYGARTFGLFSTILAVASVAGALTDLRVDAAILFIAPRHRALRLFAASVGIVSTVTVAEYLAIAVLYACCGGPAALLGADYALYLLWIPAVVLAQTLLAVYRAWLYRRSAFALSSAGQMLRAAVFAVLAIGLGLAWPRERVDITGAILMAQVGGDAATLLFFLMRTRPRERRLMLPWPPRRAVAEVRANWHFILTTSFTNLVFLVNLNIPLWTVGSVFGLQAAGWFAAARRIVATPAQFALSTLSVAFNQRIRAKQARGAPILPDVLLLIGLLLAALAPVFIALGWLAHSGHLGLLGADWAGAGSTLAVMIFIACGSIFYTAVEGLPLLFRLNRFLLVYHCGRFAVMALAALVALGGLLGYASWIELYALSEMAIYGVSAGWVVFFVRRSERRAGPRPVTMPSA